MVMISESNIVFERESGRVKGLSFHSRLPWILASLHSGSIQLWDYQSGALVHSVDGDDAHHGLPVRSVHFHKSQPLFVSGGDDGNIKVWDSDTRTCRFTLLGHSDYIRTVEFHDEQPWIISASDDKSARIWDWETRNCIAVLTGHTHYVMCASFHSKQDLVVTASLDHTIRVWDLSRLRSTSAPISSTVSEIDVPLVEPLEIDQAKYTLEGHDLGVDWAAFHPTLPLIASGADDHQVKLWEMDEPGEWHANTLHNVHHGNVTCVLFHPNKRGIVVSCSEDKSICLWDMSKGTRVETFSRDNIERFWVVDAHSETNLLAVAHDNGMIIFRLDVENNVDGGF